MSEKKSRGAGRTRNYATVVYPESAPENWLDIISESKTPIFVSPLHDMDLNPTGEPKKPHFHVIAMFESVKTKEQAIELFQSFGGVGCETVNSLRGYARYLCHLDNPEKAPYSIDSVLTYGGADYMHVIGTMADKSKAIREMCDWIRENDCDYYCDLFDYAQVYKAEWYDCLINSGGHIVKDYVKSRAYKKERENLKNSD